MARHYSTIREGLTAFLASDVQVIEKLNLGQGLELVRYCKSVDNVFYENRDKHTLSMYTRGGHLTHRMDEDPVYGAPGRFCLMPKDSYSPWHIGGTQHFVHLYFNDGYLKRLAMKVFDYDPRTVSLPELTFKEVPAVEAVIRHCILNQDWTAANRLLIEQSVVAALSHLIHFVGNRPLKQYKSGLAPGVKNRVLEYMHAHYTRQLTLAELAKVAGLSEYHFSRMFRISLAQTPHQYLQELKIQAVKQRIRRTGLKTQPLADIALDCGFANQSHMGRVFKKLTGMTPRRFAQGAVRD